MKLMQTLSPHMLASTSAGAAGASFRGRFAAPCLELRVFQLLSIFGRQGLIPRWQLDTLVIPVCFKDFSQIGTKNGQDP